jgi:tetratricopeptide (TPR) repeat protein
MALAAAAVALAAALPDDPLLEGYQAYQRGDYQTAARLFDQALRVTHDPGLAAYNQGAALAAAGRHAEAALSFRRCLEDAQGMRRLKAAYGQGTSLTETAAAMQPRAAIALLRQALASFDIALREAQTLVPDHPQAAVIRDDAEINRRIAQDLLSRKEKEPQPQDPVYQFPDPWEVLAHPDQWSRPGGEAAPRPGTRTPSGESEGAIPPATQETVPGKGTLPTRLDETTEPLSREEALRRLARSMERLRQPLGPQQTKPGAKDW